MAAAGADKDLKQAVRASLVGNVLEWYDFAVYGYMAPIMGRLFFPADDDWASLLAAFGVFAAGYLARPLGGALFGHIGDRVGRKTSLVISILAMGMATVAIGFLPDYAALGATAAVLLVILRIVQGLSVGGEYTGSIVFVTEHAPPHRRGFYAAFPMTGAVGGFVLGSLIGALVSSVLSQEQLDSWGWRLPFLFGGVIAAIGLIMRRQLSESPAVTALKQAETSPVILAFRDHWRSILKLVGLLIAFGVGFYLMFIYAAAYQESKLHFSTGQALEISSINLGIMLLAILPLSHLSDRIGRKPLLFAAAIAILVLSWPLWWLMHQGSFLLAVLGQAGFAVIFSMVAAGSAPTMVESLPAGVRCSGVSIAYNLAIGVFGGSAPLVATYLVERTHDDAMPAIYLMVVGLVMLGTLFTLRETAHERLT